MSRLLIDRTGAYDLARVSAITQASINVRDPNSPAGPGIPTRLAILHLDGGQVINTETEIGIAMQAWRDAKELEEEREEAKASIFSEMYRNALHEAYGDDHDSAGNARALGIGAPAGTPVGDGASSGS